MTICNCGGARCTLSVRDKRHATPNGYGNGGCRCAKCRVAWAAYIKARRHADPVRAAAHRDRERARRAARRTGR